MKVMTFNLMKDVSIDMVLILLGLVAGFIVKSM